MYYPDSHAADMGADVLSSTWQCALCKLAQSDAAYSAMVLGPPADS